MISVNVIVCGYQAIYVNALCQRHLLPKVKSVIFCSKHSLQKKLTHRKNVQRFDMINFFFFRKRITFYNAQWTLIFTSLLRTNKVKIIKLVKIGYIIQNHIIWFRNTILEIQVICAP